MRETKSSVLEAAHETAKDLHGAGVMEQVTLREFDQLCRPPIEPLDPEHIKRIREDSRVSQANDGGTNDAFSLAPRIRHQSAGGPRRSAACSRRSLLSSNPGNQREKMPYAAGRESEQAIGIADVDDWKT